MQARRRKTGQESMDYEEEERAGEEGQYGGEGSRGKIGGRLLGEEWKEEGRGWEERKGREEDEEGLPHLRWSVSREGATSVAQRTSWGTASACTKAGQVAPVLTTNGTPLLPTESRMGCWLEPQATTAPSASWAAGAACIASGPMHISAHAPMMPPPS